MTKEFPEWRRLHQYWRTNQYYNQYWKAPSNMKPPIHVKNLAPSTDRLLGLISGATTRTRRHSRKVEAARVKMYQHSPRVFKKLLLKTLANFLYTAQSGAIIISDDDFSELEECFPEQSGSKISSKSDRQSK